MAQDRGTARREDHPHRRLRQFLVDGRYRPLRPVLGDLLRPWPVDCWRPARQSRRRRRPLRRDLESRVHAIRAASRRRARRPAEAIDRHRHGSRAHRRGAARHARQLRHRSVPRADRGLGRSNRRAGHRRACAEPPHHRRPPPRLVLPHRRRRAAVERGQGLCASPHHAPRHAACAYPRRQGAAALSPGAGADRPDGPRLSRARAGPEPDRGDAEARGDPLPRDARARASPARRRDQGAEARRHALR